MDPQQAVPYSARPSRGATKPTNECWCAATLPPRDADPVGDPAGPWFAVAMTTSAVPVVCAAGELDRDAVEQLRGTLLAYLQHGAGSAIICDLSRARILDLTGVARLLADAAGRAARRPARLLVLPCPGLASCPVPASSDLAAAPYAPLDDIDDGLRRTRVPELEHDDPQMRRILDRTIRHALRELRSQPPYDTLDPATCQALRWRLADAAHAGVGAGPRLLAAAAGVRRALSHLNARQYRDAYFTLLTAEDHLAGRTEPEGRVPRRAIGAERPDPAPGAAPATPQRAAEHAPQVTPPARWRVGRRSIVPARSPDPVGGR